MVVKFDPGYAQYTSILSINIDYIYTNIVKFKNLGQRKNQFKMYYKQILNLTDNNVAFCLGCLLWAVYLKTLNNEEIINNPCLGSEYNEDEAVEEIIFSKNYFEQLRKDAKYYLNLDYKINSQYINVLDVYRKFLTINEGFVNTKNTNDLKLPEEIKNPENIELIKSKIDEVIENGNLSDLFELYGTIL